MANAVKPTIKYEVGGVANEVNVIRRKMLPPHVERRGRERHTVCDVLTAELTNGEELCQNREQKALEAHTEFLARHVARPLATVW